MYMKSCGNRPQSCCLEAQNSNTRFPTFFAIFVPTDQYTWNVSLYFQIGHWKKFLIFFFLLCYFSFHHLSGFLKDNPMRMKQTSIRIWENKCDYFFFKLPQGITLPVRMENSSSIAPFVTEKQHSKALSYKSSSENPLDWTHPWASRRIRPCSNQKLGFFFAEKEFCWKMLTCQNQSTLCRELDFKELLLKNKQRLLDICLISCQHVCWFSQDSGHPMFPHPGLPYSNLLVFLWCSSPQQDNKCA